MNEESEVVYYIWLRETAKLPPSHVVRALEKFGSAVDIYNATSDELKTSGCFRAEMVKRLGDKSLDASREIIEKCKNGKINIITIDDEEYPIKLREIFDPPIVLYVRGKLLDFDNEPAVSIVGQRKAKGRGLETAHMFAQVLSSHGFIIVSGLAVGVDSASHRGALDGATPTAAVFGTAIDVCYPMDNNGLLREILLHDGVAISEYPPGARAYAGNFPQRNRIVSALSCATLVVEAPRRSGSLITASYALEQGRDVFAIPGFIDRPEYEGSNALIQSGAYMATKPADIIDVYSSRFPFIAKAVEEYLPPKQQTQMTQEEARSDRLPALTPQETTVLQAIRGKTHIDQICVATQLDAPQVLISLTMLQIKGAIRDMGAKYFEPA